MISNLVGLDPTQLGIWLTFAVIVVALVMCALERLTFELTSLGVICVLLVFFHFVPVIDANGNNLLTPTRLLAGFANPALLTFIALLVMGEWLARTGVLEAGAQMFFRYGRGHAALATGLAFVAVLLVSGFMNNTHVVVIFIPIMQALASRLGQSPSKFMMSLSFAAILGGMVTLIGSSTNLLVSSMLIELGDEGFSFFQFAVPGAALGSALQATGGAEFLAGLLLGLVGDASPAVILSAFFLLVAVLASVISTKATAVLFTPIAVVFAANCSFASPVGCQTNLRVMAPGNYRFVDFVRVGTPLLIIVWLIFSPIAPWYYGLS